MIVHVGPTLAKLQAGTPFCGQGFQTVFKLLAQYVGLSVIDLLARPRTKLSLRLLAGPKLALKGGAGEDGVFRHAEMETAVGADGTKHALGEINVATNGVQCDLHCMADYRASSIKTIAKHAVATATATA